MSVQQLLPFPALVGLDLAQHALLLLAVDPLLRGVVLAAPVGSGKSSLARGFRALVGEHVPFVDLPLNADDDALLGGLDLRATLCAGTRVLRAGVLAQADGGVIYVDALNLLPDTTTNLLLGALDHGAVRFERDGLSGQAPARFALIGCYDPAEGAPRRHLLDRVGLLVLLPRTTDQHQRTAVIRRNVNPQAGKWETELAVLHGLVQAGREQLPFVTITDAQIEQLAAAALACGVESHRADLHAVRAACAAAALALRDTVEADDLELAMRLVIVPRATRVPAQNHHGDTETRRKGETETGGQGERESGEDNEQSSTTSSEADNLPTPNPQLPTPAPQEQILSALAAELPTDLADLPFHVLRRGRSGGRGSTTGTRGRHVRSTTGDMRRARIDVAATLRAAAPWQPVREPAPRVYPGNREQGTGNSDPTLHPLSLILDPSDVRVKHFRSKAGTLFCFAVDASGSMAVHRMRQAKGAVQALLQQAYVHRDRVALLAFRGSAADVLLPPSQSVELAQRALDLLPTGGGTPLASALVQGLEIARQARSRGIWQTVLVLLTDGRANVPLRAASGDVETELQQLGKQIVAAGILTIVIDTQRLYLSRGEARRLATWLNGKYVYLPHASGAEIAELARAVVDER